ncbi:hypothetical protein DFH06DRAFT_1190478 [Mycena polygramma]|nr:hypothetical protein DFH06DRAFT_1190478 [Mycena polygramma]
MSGSVLKVPLLLAVALGTHLTMTPPNPPPAPSEQLAPRGIERVAPKWIPLLIKGLFLCCIVSESLVILVQRFPSFPFAARILATLDPVGGASRLTLTRSFLVGVLLNAAGTALRVYCYAALRSLFTFELGIRTDHHLVTSGVYSVVRHPSYSGGVLSGIGVALCTLTRGAWIVECTGLAAPRSAVAAVWAVGLSGASIGLRTRMRKEDGMLKERFGREWDEWAKRVPWWLVPGVY